MNRPYPAKAKVIIENRICKTLNKATLPFPKRDLDAFITLTLQMGINPQSLLFILNSSYSPQAMYPTPIIKAIILDMLKGMPM